MPNPLAPESPDVAVVPSQKLEWQSGVAPFRKSDSTRSLAQLFSSWALYLALWAGAYLAIDHAWWLTAVLDVALAGVTVRLFIIQHDCGHGSFLATERANRWAGLPSSFLMLTPYVAWRQDHALHHATTGNLDKRGTGDVLTWTVDEYQAAPWFKQIGYRVVRNPLVMLVAGPFAVFMIGHRFPQVFGGEKGRAFHLAVHLNTLVGFGVWALVFALFGWRGFFFVHLPSLYLAAASGVFLFYVQHQYRAPYWKRTGDWDYLEACLDGSSHLELNPVLAWFSGDIGVHHLHHLAPRIPNYRLRECLDANPNLAAKTTLSLGEALRTFRFKLYDEEAGHMVGFPTRRAVVGGE